MKTITKYSKFLMVFGTLLVSACGSKSSSSLLPKDYEETLNPITINSLKEGLMHMNKEKNFTLDVYANRLLYYSIYYSDKYIGADSDGAKYMNLYVNDGKGIFSLNLANDEITSGEYETNENGGRLLDLYTSNLYPVFYDVATDYVQGFDPSVNETEITSKKWKLTFIQSIGFTSESYVSLDYLKAKYIEDTHSIMFEASFNKGLYLYQVLANNFGSTINNHYRTFIKNGGKVFAPSTEFIKFRELILSNNFARMTYDFDAGTYISMEYFHEHYFYSKYLASDTYYGYMGMNHKKTSADDQDLCGCYYFSVDSTGRPHFQSQPFSTDPDITTFMHYPSYLKLLNKMQYMKAGTNANVTSYSKSSNKYMIYDENLIKDFAKNFSLNQTWSFDVAVPFGLAIELDLKEANISKNTITFHYLFKYEGKSYDYPIPLCNFGKSDNPTLDEVYEIYND